MHMLRLLHVTSGSSFNFFFIQVENGLQNSTDFHWLSPTVVCKKIREGSVIIDMNIYLKDSEMSAFDEVTKLNNVLIILSSNSGGYFNASFLEIQNTGKVNNEAVLFLADSSSVCSHSCHCLTFPVDDVSCFHGLFMRFKPSQFVSLTKSQVTEV